MRKFIFYIAIYFIAVAYVQAQYVSYDTTRFIYKLNIDDARSLISGKTKLSEFHFHTLVDTVSHYSVSQASSYPTGYYLWANANVETVNAQMKSIHTISAVVLPNKRDLLIQVFDSLGMQIQNATVKIEDKIIEYNAKKGGYFKAKWTKEGLVEINAQGETLFYNLEKVDHNWKLLRERYRYFKTSKVGRFVTFPFRSGRSAYRYSKRAVKNNDFRIYSLRHRKNRRDLKRQYKGYTALQQPLYQPNDTVKVKAYITKHNGRRVKKEVRLTLRDQHSRGKKYFDIPIKPDKHGNYTYEFVLGDSLQLDQHYSLQFYVKNTNHRNSFNQNFYYEDYQLDEVSWTFKPAKEEFTYNDRVIFFAEGKDANGNTIPDGKVKIKLLSNQFYHHHQQQLYIPDTIWQKEIPLKARGKTQIMVPDSLLPNADMQLTAKVELLNFNGEIHKQIETFKLSRKPESIQTKIQDGYLLADFYKDGKKVDTLGTVKYNLQGQSKIYLDSIQFPFKQIINPYITNCNFSVDHNHENINFSDGVSETSSSVNVFGQWSEGKAILTLSNPHSIPVHYTIRTKNKVVQQDSTQASGTLFTSSKMNAKFFIDYSYIWGGKVYTKNQELQAYKKQLNIDVKQDSKIRPGDIVETEIKVHNYKGKPVKNVNLTAGAINNQFKKTDNFSIPQINYKPKREPFRYSNLKLSPPSRVSNSRNIRIDMSPYFFDQMQLKDHFFYRVRYDNPDGLLLQYDTLNQPKYKEICQVAPYLIRNGKEVPAEIIYINSKLVYYAGTTIKQPYSFLGYEGKNTITLRTREMEYKFVDIELRKGHKLEMVVNLNTIFQSTNQDKVKRKNVGMGLSVQEKKLLNYSLLQMQNKSQSTKYIWQDENNVLMIPSYNNRYQTQIIGPLTGNQKTGFISQDKFMRSFVFTPNYKLEISLHQERLFANTLFDISKKTNLSHRRQIHRMGQTLNTLKDIISRSPTQNKIHFDKPNFYEKENKGNYQFVLSKDSSYTAVVITNEKDNILRVLQPYNRKINSIKAGNYHLHIFTSNGFTVKHNFRIKPAHLLHEDLTQLKFEKDSLNSKFDKFVYSDTPSQTIILDDFTAQFLQKNKNGILGKVTPAKSDSTKQIFHLQLSKDDLLVADTKTDSAGYYKITCFPGAYQLKIVNQKNSSSFTLPVFVTDSNIVRLDLIYYQQAFYLNQLEVIGYKAPLIKMDHTTQGYTVTSDEIRNLPTRSINGLSSISAGVTISGSRSDATVYYIDGVQVRGNLIPDSELGFSTDQAFTRTISGTVRDTEGEPVMFCNVAIYVDGVLVAGTESDFDGQYAIRAPEGNFDLEVSFIGFETTRIKGAYDNVIDVVLEEGGVNLDEVAIVAYKEPLINKSLSTNLADPPPLEGGVQLRTNFQDYAYWQPNLITDENGKASFQTTFPDKLTSWRTFVIGMNKKQQAGVAYANTKSFKPLSSQLLLPRFLLAGDETEIIGKSVNYTSNPYPIETRFLQEDEVIQKNKSNIREALLETTKIQAPTNVDSLSLTYDLKTGEYGDGEKRTIPIFPNAINETLGQFHILKGDTTLSLNIAPSKGPLTIYAQSDMLKLMLEDLEYLNKYPYGCNEQTASRLIGLLLEKQIKESLGQNYEHEDKIIKMIVRLKKNQNKDGSWAWWPQGQAMNWINIHILKALNMANEAGYKTTAFDRGMQYVTNYVTSASTYNQVQLLDLFSSMDHGFDYEKQLAKLDTLPLSLKDQFTIIKIKQEQNLPYQLDSLETHRRSTVFGGSYWGNNSMNIISQDIDLCLLAYQIYKNDNQKDRLTEIRQYLLMRRSELSQTYGIRFGRNTYETAQILVTLLPDFLAKQYTATLVGNSLTINGQSSKTVSKFPYKEDLVGETNIEIKKAGTGIMFFTAYQKFLNPDPSPKRDLINIKTKLVQNGKSVKSLKQGEHIKLVVDIKVNKAFEYALVEIPIPAACSYFSKPNYRRGVEVHREYFKNKTAIFCQNLPEGEHQFTINLEVRFAGSYSLLPVKIEQMYFPIFYGRNEMKKVKVN